MDATTITSTTAQAELNNSMPNLLLSQHSSDFSIICHDKVLPLPQNHPHQQVQGVQENVGAQHVLDIRTVANMLKFIYARKIATEKDTDSNRAELGQLFVASDKYELVG